MQSNPYTFQSSIAKKRLSEMAGVFLCANSRNDVRKAFSKSERVDYMYRLMRIEKEKARERKESTLKQNADTVSLKSDERGRADKKTADAFGIGRDTMRKEMQIVEHKDLLDPADFADWDEGKLSTNKAYQQMKARMKQLEEENERLHDDNKEFYKKLRYLKCVTRT